MVTDNGENVLGFLFFLFILGILKEKNKKLEFN